MFDVTRKGDRWECRPTWFMARFGAVLLLCGAGFCLGIAGMFFSFFPDTASLAVGAAWLSAALLVGWQAWRFGRLGRVPLVVGGGGRVSYDGRELCRPGSVRAVRIVRDLRPESGDWRVVLETSDGGEVELEGPYFGTANTREAARVLAGELAQALKVEAVEA